MSLEMRIEITFCVLVIGAIFIHWIGWGRNS